MTDRLLCDVDGGVADVRLNRPEKRNALDLALFADLRALGDELAGDRSVRAVVLSGAGKGFCAGLDMASLQAIVGQGDATDHPSSLFERDGRITSRAQHACFVWTEMPAPVIAAVHGDALGGGLQLALAADLRVIAPDARLSMAEIRWGAIPDMTGTQLLPRLVGVDVAKDLILTGRTVTGEEAGALGLASRVAEDPRATAMALAAEIASRNPDAVRAAKALVNTAMLAGVADGFAAEVEAIRSIIGSANQVEAATAALEGRQPSFAD